MKARASWIAFVSKRLTGGGRVGGGLPALLSALGIAIGAATLIVVLSVMNGFQSGFIESILTIDSYDIRASGDIDRYPGLAGGEVGGMPGVVAATSFSDSRGLLFAGSAAFQARIRAIDVDAALADTAFMEAIDLLPGSELPQGSEDILLGAELARSLRVDIGDALSTLSITEDGDGLSASPLALRVCGLFKSGYYDFDSGLAFSSLAAARRLDPGGGSLDMAIGIRLANRSEAQERCGALAAVFPGLSFRPWSEFNASFFGALRGEKTAMLFLVGLVFIVVAININNSMRRTVFERSEEIAVMKATGAKDSWLIAVFALEGGLIGLAGAAAGTVAGLSVAADPGTFFSLVEGLVNAASSLAAAMSGSGAPPPRFSLFSPTDFYLDGIPSVVKLSETVYIFMAAMLSSLVAGIAASRRLASLQPSEVLRYE